MFSLISSELKRTMEMSQSDCYRFVRIFYCVSTFLLNVFAFMMLKWTWTIHNYAVRQNGKIKFTKIKQNKRKIQTMHWKKINFKSFTGYQLNWLDWFHVCRRCRHFLNHRRHSNFVSIEIHYVHVGFGHHPWHCHRRHYCCLVLLSHNQHDSLWPTNLLLQEPHHCHKFKKLRNITKSKCKWAYIR